MQTGAWLRDARAQERDRGVDYRELACYAAKLTPYIRDHLAPALRDLEVLYAELPPPTAEERTQRDFWEDFRPEYVQRVCDALQHVTSALVAVGCNDEEAARVRGLVPDGEAADDVTPVITDDGDEEPVSMEETITLPVSDIRPEVEQARKK